VSKDLPGFDKTVPSSRPTTRGEKPVSAWDIDLSPFHSLIEQQATASQHIVDAFLNKMEKMLADLQKGNKEDKSYSIQEKILHNQKKQVSDNTEIRKALTDISEQLIEIRQLLKEMLDKDTQLLSDIQKNTSDLIRPVTAQENLIREGFAPSQMLAPLERLVVVEEDSLSHLESLLAGYSKLFTAQENMQTQYTLFLEQISLFTGKLTTMEGALLTINNMLQANLSDKKFMKEQFEGMADTQNKLFARVIHYCERMAQGLESFNASVGSLGTLNELLQRQLEFSEKERKYKQTENIVFWIFVAIALVLFVWIVVKSRWL
jgi:hypothetical protein